MAPIERNSPSLPCVAKGQRRTACRQPVVYELCPRCKFTRIFQAYPEKEKRFWVIKKKYHEDQLHLVQRQNKATENFRLEMEKFCEIILQTTDCGTEEGKEARANVIKRLKEYRSGLRQKECLCH